MNFNPRPREEGDQCISPPVQATVHFNPRPREEGDAETFSRFEDMADFNPRPREEGDDSRLYSRNFDYISIHALVKRATDNVVVLHFASYHFNPRPREEGDVYRLYATCSPLIFQSTPS